jgi:ribosomal protein L9
MFTPKERNLIARALTIAAEDGSIYNTEHDEAQQAAADKEVNAEMEAIRRKLAADK